MTNPHFQNRLDLFMKDRAELVEEVTRLRNGDDMGIVYSADPNREEILVGSQRIAKMIENRIYRISKMDSRIGDYCNNMGLENPIPNNEFV